VRGIGVFGVDGEHGGVSFDHCMVQQACGSVNKKCTIPSTRRVVVSTQRNCRRKRRIIFFAELSRRNEFLRRPSVRNVMIGVMVGLDGRSWRSLVANLRWSK
jgi:hypothetical protein